MHLRRNSLHSYRVPGILLGIVYTTTHIIATFSTVSSALALAPTFLYGS